MACQVHTLRKPGCLDCWQDFTVERTAAYKSDVKTGPGEAHLAAQGIRGRFLEMTFESYKPENERAEQALTICQDFAAKPSGALALIGNMGTGKTHLAVSIARATAGTYTRLLAMVRHIRDSYRGEGDSEQKRIDFWASRPLLVLDEIGVQVGSESERMLAFEILDERYIMRRPAVIVSNGNRESLEQFLGARSVDRLAESGKVIVFDWDSYRRRM